MNSNFKRFIEFSAGHHAKCLINPLLKRARLSYFLFVKTTEKKHSRIWLTNRGDWTEEFYKNQFYRQTAFEQNQQIIEPGLYLWHTLPGQNVYQIAREHFDIAHGITIVENYREETELYHFGVDREKVSMSNLYLNNTEALYQFIVSFRYLSKSLINDTIKKRDQLGIEIPLNSDCNQTMQSFYQKDNLPDQSFLDMSDIKKIQLSDEHGTVYLTLRELECVKLLIKGLRTHDIAKMLGLSKRTVETHIESIKRKLNCDNQFLLGYKVAKLKIL